MDDYEESLAHSMVITKYARRYVKNKTLDNWNNLHKAVEDYESFLDKLHTRSSESSSPNEEHKIGE